MRMDRIQVLVLMSVYDLKLNFVMITFDPMSINRNKI